MILGCVCILLKILSVAYPVISRCFRCPFFERGLRALVAEDIEVVVQFVVKTANQHRSSKRFVSTLSKFEAVLLGKAPRRNKTPN